MFVRSLGAVVVTVWHQLYSANEFQEKGTAVSAWCSTCRIFISLVLFSRRTIAIATNSPAGPAYWHFAEVLVVIYVLLNFLRVCSTWGNYNTVRFSGLSDWPRQTFTELTWRQKIAVFLKYVVSSACGLSPVLKGQSVLPISHIFIPSVNMNVLKMMPSKNLLNMCSVCVCVFE